MFDINWVDNGAYGIYAFFSRLGMRDHQNDILALDKAHRDNLDELVNIKNSIKELHIKDKSWTVTDEDLGSMYIDPNGNGIGSWLEHHYEYKLGEKYYWADGKLEDTERVVVRALAEREKELIESSNNLCKEIADLMVKGDIPLKDKEGTHS